MIVEGLRVTSKSCRAVRGGLTGLEI